MATVSVVVDRTGGGNARFARVGASTDFTMGASDERAIEWVSAELVLHRSSKEEIDRVVALLRKRLRYLRRVELTAEVPGPAFNVTTMDAHKEWKAS